MADHKRPLMQKDFEKIAENLSHHDQWEASEDSHDDSLYEYSSESETLSSNSETVEK